MQTIAGKIVEIEYSNKEGEIYIQRFIETAVGMFPIVITEDASIEIPKERILSKTDVGTIQWKRQR